jgi:hypothetical protein
MDIFTIVINVSMTVCIIALTLIMLTVIVAITVESVWDWKDRGRILTRDKGEWH